MNKVNKRPRTWRASDARWHAMKVWCTNNKHSVQDFIDMAVEIEAKAQGFRLPS